MGGRVLGPLGVVAVFVVIIVIARGNAADPDATPATLDFTSGTSVTLATTTTTSTTSAEAQSELPTDVTVAGWSPLPGNELEERRGFAAVRAGDRVVVWGGVGPTGIDERSDGASFLHGRWTPIAQSPIVASSDPVTVWTGSELFVYSGATAA